MTDNALFYTFSTVAQALPAGFGLLAGAAIFRVTAVTSAASEKSAEFMIFLRKWSGLLDVASLTHLAKQRDFIQLENEFHAMCVKSGSNRVTMQAEGEPDIAAAKEATELLRLSQRVHKFLRIALVLTVLTTGIAVTSLPFTPQICLWDTAWLLVSLVVLLALFTLFMSGWLTSVLIKEAGTENPLGPDSSL